MSLEQVHNTEIQVKNLQVAVLQKTGEMADEGMLKKRSPEVSTHNKLSGLDSSHHEKLVDEKIGKAKSLITISEKSSSIKSSTSSMFSRLPNGDKFDHKNTSSRDENHTNQKRKQLASCDSTILLNVSNLWDSTYCVKEVTKMFLVETFCNEKIHKERFKMLPDISKLIVRFIIKDSLDEEIPENLEGHSRYQNSDLIHLSNKAYQKLLPEVANLIREKKSLAFFVKCYMKELQKQVNKKCSISQESSLEGMLFNKLHPASSEYGIQEERGKCYEDFSRTINLLTSQTNFGSSEALTKTNLASIKTNLTPIFLAKLRALPIEVLNKHYHRSIIGYLTTFFSLSMPIVELLEQMQSSPKELDLFSSFVRLPQHPHTVGYKLLAEL